MNNLESKLLTIVKSNRKVSVEKLLNETKLTFPNLDADEQNSTLLNILLKLESKDIISLPSKKKKENWNVLTLLPNFISKRRSEKLIDKRKEELRKIRDEEPWFGKMELLGPKVNLVESQLKKAIAINQFIISVAHNDEISYLPVRERALQLLGDEKAFDGVHRKGLFSGKIDVDDLRIYRVPEPLPYQTPLADVEKLKGKPLLICENVETWYSACRFNENKQYYSAIIYGKGNRITDEELALHSLNEICKRYESGVIEYFGDVDPIGFQIPITINKIRSAMQCDVLLAPAIKLYEALVKMNRVSDLAHSWPDNLNENDVRTWMKEFKDIDFVIESMTKLRWPQEGLTERNMMIVFK